MDVAPAPAPDDLLDDLRARLRTSRRRALRAWERPAAYAEGVRTAVALT